MSESSNGRSNVLNLGAARQRTPAVSGIKAMQQSLQLVLFGAVTSKDVEAMATRLKEMALAGDLRAMKLFFQLVMGSPQVQAAPPIEVQQQVGVLGHPVTEQALTDEEALAGYRGPRASQQAGVVAERQVLLSDLEARAARGMPLFPDPDGDQR